jgi:dTDP-4-dehydrorhamnose reductase
VKVVILSSTGLLGFNLVKAFPGAQILNKADMDILDGLFVSKKLKQIKPDIVINDINFSDIKACEEDKELAKRINGKSMKGLAQTCKDIGALLIYFSTDYVFNGKKREYLEDDEICPLNAYGNSKAIGEKYIQNSGCNFRIIRTSGVFGCGDNNIIEDIIKISYISDIVMSANDVYCQITYAPELIAKTKEIIGLNSGIYHVTNDGVPTWFDVSEHVIANALPSKLTENDKLLKHSILKNTKIKSLQSWKDALKMYKIEKMFEW